MPSMRVFGSGVISLIVWLALAGSAAGAPVGADGPEARELLEQLRQRYEVLVDEDSYILKPAADGEGFLFLEIRGGRVTLDGEPMTPEALEERLGDASGQILSLARTSGVTVELESFPDEPAELEVPEARRSRRVATDDRVSFASSMTIDENESARDVVVIGGSLEVLGEVDGDAVVVGGSVEIRGEVDGSVTAVGGSVFLGPDAVVDGDVSAIGGKIEREDGAKIRGGTTEISLGAWEGLKGVDWDFGPWWSGWGGGWFGWVDLVERVVTTGLLCVFVLFVVLIARGYVDSIADRARREPWKAALVGLIAEVLFVPVVVVVFIVLMVSIIGIPLALILIPASLLGIVILFLAGYAGIAQLIGELFGRRFRLGPLNAFAMVLLGIALIQSWSIIGEALSFLGGPIQIAAWMLLLTGFLIKYIAWTVGLGSVLLHGFSPLPARAVGSAALPPGPPPLYPPPVPPFLSRGDAREDRIYEQAGAPPAAPGGPPPAPAEPGSGADPPDQDRLYREAGAQSLDAKKPS